MATVTIHLIGPLSGTELGATVGVDDKPAEIVDLLQRADKAAAALLERGWGDVRPGAGQAAELAMGPTFCGYLCSPGVDAAGFPAWIIADGVKYQKREKQGDTWYSAGSKSDGYKSILQFRVGEQPPAVVGLD